MRLKSIKLAGFKSFVDATTFPFPKNLNAVVGPNGCGKSNTIDAVRWVMGETSAKNLRGESSVDVIFNGSQARKPVGQCSVELVFDNSEGKLAGQYAAFAEISVRRVLTRDGKSTYFLNGTKCRRRDVTDLFLGTGLGPRSYAIIEQGMISRLIESKPDELRVFIEEAAGISKYKERRKETENRIRRTRENMERLADIRDELGRQLEHLHEQAQTAEKYTQYKEQERTLRLQLLAIRWQELKYAFENKNTEILRLQTAFEKHNAQQTHFDTLIEKDKQQLHILNDKFQHVQNKFYAKGTEIARIEQSLIHEQKKATEQKQELSEIDEQLQQLQVQMEADLQEKAIVEATLDEVLPEYEELQISLMQAQEDAATSEANYMAFQNKWRDKNAAFENARSQYEILKNKSTQLQDQIEKDSERLAKAKQTKHELESRPDLADEMSLHAELELAQAKLDEAEATAQEKLEQLDSFRQKISEKEKRLSHKRRELETLNGKISTLTTLQEAHQKQSEATQTWLQENGYQDLPTLHKLLELPEQYSGVFEFVLQRFLNSPVLPQDAVSLEKVKSLSEANVEGVWLIEGLLSQAQAEHTSLVTNLLSSPLVKLGDLVEGADHIKASTQVLVENIYVAENIEQALQFQSQLNASEKIVSADGWCIGASWIEKWSPESEHFNQIETANKLDFLNEMFETVDVDVEDIEASIEHLRLQLHQAESRYEASRREVSVQSKAHGQVLAKLSANQAKTEQMFQQLHQLDVTIEELSEHIAQNQHLQQEAKHEYEQASAILSDSHQAPAEVEDQMQQLQLAYQQNREQLNQIKAQAHAIELEKSQLNQKIESISQAHSRLATQHEKLKLRQMQLSLPETGTQSEEVEELKSQLELLLEDKLILEEDLAEQKIAIQTCEDAISDNEKARINNDQDALRVREKLEKLKMDEQSVKVKQSTIEEQIKEQNYDLKTLCENLPEEFTEAQCEGKLNRTLTQIKNLGAINLAAIEEYQLQKERKTYLDEQYDDLNEALETLSQAIARIDKETKARFKTTFDHINNDLKTLFPKVFGGGSAYLALTENDLLTTGVTIMAQPPGKKNSTIHLLSGGEKALTAIALVFSIFKLNPAPFCMLDEVDAPLDDANVGRYANLVKSMADQVQFIFITHNKVAMEMADTLLGVTMHEPGVSRLVSVDVEEAAALVEA